jgi:hypothetical protein
MASAWWKSWGAAWGASWGSDEAGSASLAGTAEVVRFTASADLSLSGAPEPQPEPGFGGGLPWREWVRRPKEEDEAILLAVLH